MNSVENNRNLKKVLNGDFPKEALQKMSRKRLEQFVLSLVRCSSDESSVNDAKDFTGLYRGLCLKEINKPLWWPSENVIMQSLSSDGKHFMDVLRFLVYRCCEFFKKPSSEESLNLKLVVTESDKNSRGVKRKATEQPKNEISSPSKRRTLMPNNVKIRCYSPLPPKESVTVQNPVVLVKDVLSQPAPKPLTQDAFLTIFGLQNTFLHNIEDPPSLSTPNYTIKFTTCSIIPISSDLGRELMKRDNHNCSEALKARRLDRLEWYVNKPPPRANEISYEISYQEKKDATFRYYKFPKRQIWQHPGDMTFQIKALICKRLSVILVNEDLIKLQKKVKRKAQCQLKVLVPRMSFTMGIE